MRIALFTLLTALALGCSSPKYKNPHVVIYTTMGDIELELFPDKAPKSVAAFLSYIDSGYYNKGSFYRVLKADELPSSFNTGIIQGGMFQVNGKAQPNIPGIPHESTRQSGLSHKDGTVSLARTLPGTANTEFFICIGDQLQFDYGKGDGEDQEGYAAFGTVFKGMDIVRKIQNERSSGEHFDAPIVISKIRKL